MERQAWSASILAIHKPSIKGLHRISSLVRALCRTRVEVKNILLLLLLLLILLLLLSSSSSSSRRAGSDGSIPASGSAGPGFDPLRGSKYSFENFETRD